MATNKIRTNVYIDKDVKEQAQKLFSPDFETLYIKRPLITNNL